MFAMTTPLDGICSDLLNARTSLEHLVMSNTFKALQMLDPMCQEYLEEAGDQVDRARQCLITYTEALRNDRREKRQRYLINKKLRASRDASKKSLKATV